MQFILTNSKGIKIKASLSDVKDYLSTFKKEKNFSASHPRDSRWCSQFPPRVTFYTDAGQGRLKMHQISVRFFK